jgi:hypothetical protein
VGNDATPDYLASDETVALLADSRFWSAFFNVAFIWQKDALDGDLVEAAIGVNDATVLPWWEQLSGYYDGIFDDSDGDLERPKTIRVPLAGGDQIDIEIHAGALRYRTRRGLRVMQIAEISGHWSLPGLSWAEIRGMASAVSPGSGVPSATALLLFLPLAHPFPAHASLDAVQVDVERSIRDLGIAQPEGAATLAAAWRHDAEAAGS